MDRIGVNVVRLQDAREGGDFLYGWGVSSSGAWRMKIEYEERVEERVSQFSRSHLSTVTL